MDQILLFGDSITQQTYTTPAPDGFSFSAALSDAYIRRLDVVNRGFSGYNTRQGLWALPRILRGSLSPTSSLSSPRLITVCLGANDARLPDTGAPEQHVPRDEYARNLARIVGVFREEFPRAAVLLITPPPVHEGFCVADDAAQLPSSATTRPEPIVRRTAPTTRAYAAAAKDVGQKLGVPVLDLWGVMMSWVVSPPPTAAQLVYPEISSAVHDLPHARLPGADLSAPGSTADADVQRQHDRLRLLLRDGLHLSSVGYRVFYESLMRKIVSTWPDLSPEKLEYVLPAWDREGVWQGIVDVPAS